MKTRRWIAASMLALLSIGCSGKGAQVRAQIRPGMSFVGVLTIAKGWLFCTGVPENKPTPEARIRVSANVLDIQGFGAEDKRSQHGRPEEVAAAAGAFLRAHPGKWTFTFGYVVVPRRQYFDVVFDADGRVASVSGITLGGP
jgi:hypothetical protein